MTVWVALQRLHKCEMHKCEISMCQHFCEMHLCEMHKCEISMCQHFSVAATSSLHRCSVAIPAMRAMLPARPGSRVVCWWWHAGHLELEMPAIT